MLFGRAFWEKVLNWQALAEAGVINPSDLDLFQFVETAEEALAAMDAWGCPPSHAWEGGQAVGIVGEIS